MSDENADDSIEMTDDERKAANVFIVKHLQHTMTDEREELDKLRSKLSITYWVIVVTSSIMFIMGCVLISVPFIAAFRSEIGELQSLIAAGFGIADLAALFLFRPTERIHKLMGDMSQVILSLDSFQIQVGLRLMQMNTDERSTLGQASDYISVAAKDSIKLIQEYFEEVH